MQTFYKHDNEGIKKKSVMMYSSLQMVGVPIEDFRGHVWDISFFCGETHQNCMTFDKELPMTFVTVLKKKTYLSLFMPVCSNHVLCLIECR